MRSIIPVRSRACSRRSAPCCRRAPRRWISAPRAMIVIDDLQWGDDDSLELLALLVQRVDLPLTIVASWTTLGPVPDRLRALLDRLDTLVRVVDVPPMAEDRK